MDKLIHFSLFDPANSFFKQKKSEKASVRRGYCSISESCELLKRGECVNMGLFTGRCPYGHVEREIGPTRRARNYYQWISSRKEVGQGIPFLNGPTEKMARIGEYVYLPYSHISMNERVPFLGHSHILATGRPFLKTEDWNVDMVQLIVDFRPQALFGGEIRDYQQKVVPKFLLHLAEFDKSLYDEVLKTRPDFITRYALENRNHVGRKALLLTLTAPFTIRAKHHEYPVDWRWDGKLLRTESKDAYSSTWGAIKDVDKIETVLTPNQKTAIVVQDNAWVNDKTVFID